MLGSRVNAWFLNFNFLFDFGLHAHDGNNLQLAFEFALEANRISISAIEYIRHSERWTKQVDAEVVLGNA